MFASVPVATLGLAGAMVCAVALVIASLVGWFV